MRISISYDSGEISIASTFREDPGRAQNEAGKCVWSEPSSIQLK